MVSYFLTFVPESKTDKILKSHGGGLSTYFQTFITESKTDKIPKSRVDGGGRLRVVDPMFVPEYKLRKSQSTVLMVGAGGVLALKVLSQICYIQSNIQI